MPRCILDSKVDMFEHSEYGCVEVTSWKEREEKKEESKRKRTRERKNTKELSGLSGTELPNYLVYSR